MIAFIRGVVTRIVADAGKLMRCDFSTWGDGSVTDREVLQQYGIQSRPPEGSEVIALHRGNAIIVVASDNRQYRIALEEGDIVIRNSVAETAVKLMGNEIRIEAPTVIVDANSVKLTGESSLKKLLTEDLLSALPLHTHAGVMAGNSVTGTATFTPPLSAALHATAKTEAA
jgi:phage gp45-like